MAIKSQAVAGSRCGCEPGPGENSVVTMVKVNNVKPGAPAVPEDTEAAFRSLYAEHGLALLRLTTTLTRGDRGRAEDLVQETKLQAWTHRNHLDIRHRCP